MGMVGGPEEEVEGARSQAATSPSARVAQL